MNPNKEKLPLHPFRSSSSQKQQQELSGSLTSSLSLDLSDRLAAWSGSNNRTHPCSMRFHKQWQHPDCKVMRWYKVQTQSSTQFQSIQHWRSSEGPFYHEYLLIKLTDGSLCRVERMGEGSRADALSWVGCNAHDIIQWFSAEDYVKNSNRKPPKLIIEVCFPQHFDLLDVLAICYSIQQHPKSATYTLQRYNCYFLCSTILAVLTRRIGVQESSITETQWTQIVANTLGDLSRTKHRDALEFLASGIFTLLHPDNQSLAGFVFESLRSSLDGTALAGLNNELSGMLWQKDLPLAVENGLITPLSSATHAILNGNSHNSTMLHRLVWRFGEEFDSEADPNPPSIQKAVSEVVLRAYSEGMKHYVECKQQKFKMRQLEAKNPLYRRLAASAYRCTVIYPWSMYKLHSRLKEDVFVKVLSELRSHYHVTPGQLFSALPLQTLMASGTVFLGEDDIEPENDPDLSEAFDNAFKLSMERAFPILQRFIDAEPQDIQGALAFLKTYFMEDFWEMGIWMCVLREIVERIRNLPTSKTIKVSWGNTETDWTVADFQNHLWGRIQDHAQRVELFKLAAAPLVEQDMKKAMSDVWRSLPVQNGSSTITPSVVGPVRQKFTQLPSLWVTARLLRHSQDPPSDV